MSHSMIAADRRAHCKILAVAFVAALSVITLASAAWRADIAAPNAQASTTASVVKAGKPTISASIGATVIR
jgi:hypothetical protein